MADFKLTWVPQRKCWRKYREGKTYYLGKGKCSEKYDREGYATALAEWGEIAAKLNEQPTSADK